MTDSEISDFIQGHRWKFAKSMPKNPHEYTLKEWCANPAIFDRLVMHIREYGYPKKFWRKTFMYLDVGPHCYWTMGAPIEETILINRALRKDHRHSSMMPDCHSALDSERKSEPVLHFQCPQGLAFQHDVMNGIHPTMLQADVFYSEPPWRHGYQEFCKRAALPIFAPYNALLLHLQREIVQAGKPTVLISGKHALRTLNPEHVCPVTLNRRDALAFLWNVRPWIDRIDTVLVLSRLAEQFSCVGDFCCGYGRAGWAFARAGKTYILSDVNARCIGYIAMYAGTWA